MEEETDLSLQSALLILKKAVIN